MDRNIIEEQIKMIMNTCKVFDINARTLIETDDHEMLDSYGFLATIGSELGKIQKEINSG